MPGTGFELLEDRLTPSIATVAGDLPPWLTDAPTNETASISAEPGESQTDHVADSLTEEDNAAPWTPPGIDPGNASDDAMWAFTTTASVEADAIDQVFAENPDFSDDNQLSDTSRDFAALAPAFLEAAFQKQNTVSLAPVAGALQDSHVGTQPQRLSSFESFKLASALFGVGGWSNDDANGPDWHTSHLGEPAPSKPAEPIAEPVRSPVPQEPESSASPRSGMAKTDDEIVSDADKGMVAVAADTAPPSENASPLAAPRTVPSTGARQSRGGFGAALMLWCVLLVAQCRALRSSPTARWCVTKHLHGIAAPPDPRDRRPGSANDTADHGGLPFLLRQALTRGTPLALS